MADPTSPGVTIAVAHDALGDLFQVLLDVFASQNNLPMGNINGLVTAQPNDSYFINSVDVSGGVISSPTIQVGAAEPTSGPDDGTFTANVTLSGRTVYNDWHEYGTDTHVSSHGTFVDPYDDHFEGQFSFDLTLPMSLKVTIGCSSDSTDPWDPQRVLTVQVQSLGVSAGQTPTVTNVVVPSESALNVGAFFGAFTPNAPGEIATALQQVDMVTPCVAALNTMFALLPDSGKLTPDLTFLFPPTQIVFPSGGGFQMGVSGRLITAAGARYPGPAPQGLALPPLPSLGMTVSFNEYLLNEIAWYESQAGTLSRTYPSPGAAPADWNTNALKADLPQLWDFAPAAPFQLMLTSDPLNPPTFAFMPAWQASKAVLQAICCPADVQATLTDSASMIFASSDDLTAVLKSLLSPSNFAQWGAAIVAEAAGYGLAITTPYAVAMTATLHEQATKLVWFTLTLTHWMDTIGLHTDSQAGKQAVTFTVNSTGYKITNVGSAADLAFSAADAQTLYDDQLKLQVQDLTMGLSDMGTRGVSVPALPGFVLANPTLTVTASEVLVQGRAINSAIITLMTGSSPAVALLSDGSYIVVYQTDAGEIRTFSNVHGEHGLEQFMNLSGTSPSVTAQANGGYVIAYRGNQGSLCFHASGPSPIDTHLAMMQGTSPSITTLTDGSFLIAVQDDTGTLQTYSTAGTTTNLQQGLNQPNTSPSITATANGGFEIAFRANSGTLFGNGTSDFGTQLTVAQGTSPSITTLTDGTFVIATQGATGELQVWTSANGLVQVRRNMS
ncbi:MAG: hypothetical protein Q8M65_09540 [Rhodoglobus sp.]|nr:hypothetical protein [Rhodoglobus sp.]